MARTADRASFESEYLSALTGGVVAPAAVSPARVAYIESADAVCAASDLEVGDVYATALSGVPDDAEWSVELLGQIWTGLEPIIRSQIVSLRAIPPPADDADELDTLYDDLADAVDAVSTMVDAALAGDDEALATITGGSSGPNPIEEANRALRDFGFRICGAEQ